MPSSWFRNTPLPAQTFPITDDTANLDAVIVPTVGNSQMLDLNGGGVEYALAAYNAGQDRVDDWRKNGNFADVEEFVESIPFTQTREYVQAIMRNAVIYKLLYSKS